MVARGTPCLPWLDSLRKRLPHFTGGSRLWLPLVTLNMQLHRARGFRGQGLTLAPDSLLQQGQGWQGPRKHPEVFYLGESKKEREGPGLEEGQSPMGLELGEETKLHTRGGGRARKGWQQGCVALPFFWPHSC